MPHSARFARLARRGNVVVCWGECGDTFRIDLVSLCCHFGFIGIQFGFHFRNYFVYFNHFGLHLGHILAPLRSYLGILLGSPVFPLPKGWQSAPEGPSGGPFGLPLASPGGPWPPFGSPLASPGPSLDPPGPSLGPLRPALEH